MALFLSSRGLANTALDVLAKGGLCHSRTTYASYLQD
jgi:hypothetical protein